MKPPFQNVGSYFSYSAFQLGHSITRSDGSSVVSESLVVTGIGIAAGISQQGSLATKNNVGTGDLAAASATDSVMMSNTSTYTGSGDGSTGSANGGSGGTTTSGGSGGVSRGAGTPGTQQP